MVKKSRSKTRARGAPPAATERPAWRPPPALGAALAALIFLAVAAWRADLASFGYFHDDTLYFTAAQAIATGQGNVLPSVPDRPAQTKYPPLYSVVLAAVWKIAPEFPRNVRVAVGLNLMLGAVLVAGWFVLLEDLGAGPWEALAIAALAGLHPFVLSLAGAVLTDVPFMALAVWAVVLAGRALRGGDGRWAGVVVLSILAVLTRSVAIAVLGGVGLAALLRKAWRPAAFYLILTGSCFVGSFWWSAAHKFSAPGLPGYRQTLLFYTSYFDFWKISVPDSGALLAMAGSNLWEAVRAPAALCLPLQALPENPYGQGVFLVLVTAAILAGALYLEQREWHPFHFALLFHVPVIALWNYPLANRFLLLFLPLFFLGLWRIAQRAVRVRSRAAGIAAGVVMALLALDASYGYLWGLPEQMAAGTVERARLGAEKNEAYDWIRDHTQREDRFIAYEDASLYLSTGRQALRPLAFSSEANYRNTEAVVARDLEHLSDTARQIRARYWLASSDDYQLEAGAPVIQQRARALVEHFPRAFRSRGGRVEIFQVNAE